MCEDYIKRSDAIELFRSVADGVGSDCPWTIEAIVELINRQEAADVAAVVHGRWIVRHKGMNNWVDCSECGTMGSPHWKGCPVCLARMDGK